MTAYTDLSRLLTVLLTAQQSMRGTPPMILMSLALCLGQGYTVLMGRTR